MRFHDRRGISAALLKGRQMEQHNLIITENTRILTDVFRMTLKGDGLDGHKPGQFVNLKIDGCFLRRPISVYDAGKDFVTILYKIVGKGTKLLAAAVPGSRLDVLTHLGNGFDPGVRCKRPLLIGGGIGCPPLYLLAKELRASGKTPAVLLGFNAPSEADSIPLKSAWAAASAHAWDAAAGRNTAANGSARTAQCCTGRKSYGK